MKKLLLLTVLSSFAWATAALADPCPGTDGWVYSDLDAADPFCAAATWLAVQGISKGCETIDETHRNFCPDSATSRLQMAAFMKRLANATAPTRAYASFYNDTGGTVLIMPAIFNPISLPTTAVSNGVIADPFGNVIVPTDGDYRLHYCVRVAPAVQANTQLVVNGVQLAGSAIVRSSAVDTWCRDVTAPLVAGDNVQLQMYGDLFNLATLSAPGGAELTLERIGP